MKRLLAAAFAGVLLLFSLPAEAQRPMYMPGTIEYMKHSPVPDFHLRAGPSDLAALTPVRLAVIGGPMYHNLSLVAFGNTNRNFMVETRAIYTRNTIYGRYEWFPVRAARPDLFDFGNNLLLDISTLSFGYTRVLMQMPYMNFAVGGQMTMNFAISPLIGSYGNLPMAGQVYLRFSALAYKGDLRFKI